MKVVRLRAVTLYIALVLLCTSACSETLKTTIQQPKQELKSRSNVNPTTYTLQIHKTIKNIKSKRIVTAKNNEWDYPLLNLLITFLGLLANSIIAIFTIKAVRRATTQAQISEQALEIASNQTTISGDTAKKQLRAYVNKFDCLILNITNPTKRKIEAKIKNYGTTPASNMLATMQLQVLDKDSAPPSLENLIPIQSFGVLSPSAQIALHANDLKEISERTWHLLGNSEKILYILVVILYDDIYGVQHKTEITFKHYSSDNSDMIIPEIAESGNTAS